MMTIDPYILLFVVIIIFSIIIILLRWYQLSESYFGSGLIIGFSIGVFFTFIHPEYLVLNIISYMIMGAAIGSLFRDKNLVEINHQEDDYPNQDDDDEETELEKLDDGKVKILYQGIDDRTRGFEVVNDIIKNHENINENDISYVDEPGIYNDAFLKNHDRKVLKNFLLYLTNDKSKYKIAKDTSKGNDDKINVNEIIMEYEVYLYDKKEKELAKKKMLEETNDS